MESQNQISLCTVLFLVFLVLKLTKLISWSWWWVTAPLWVPFGIYAGIFMISMIVLVLLQIYKAITHND